MKDDAHEPVTQREKIPPASIVLVATVGGVIGKLYAQSRLPRDAENVGIGCGVFIAMVAYLAMHKAFDIWQRRR